MRISVIIPAYITSQRGWNDLERLVKKIYQQMNGDHELIVVNDSSTWDFKIETRGSHPNLKYYRLPKNRGVSVARNYGIEHSVGEWLFFVDADDDIPNDFIATLDATAGLDELDGTDDHVDIYQLEAKHQDGNVAYPIPCAWGKLVSRKWIGDDRFDPDQLIGEEDTLFKKPGKDSKISYVPKIAYYHRQDANPNSLMKRFWRGEIPRRRGDDAEKQG